MGFRLTRQTPLAEATIRPSAARAPAKANGGRTRDVPVVMGPYLPPGGHRRNAGGRAARNGSEVRDILCVLGTKPGSDHLGRGGDCRLGTIACRGDPRYPAIGSRGAWGHTARATDRTAGLP